jgi:hypothetical protein
MPTEKNRVGPHSLGSLCVRQRENPLMISLFPRYSFKNTCHPKRREIGLKYHLLIHREKGLPSGPDFSRMKIEERILGGSLLSKMT